MHTHRRRANWFGLVIGFLVIFLLAGIATIAIFEYTQIKQLKTDLERAQVETGNAKTDSFELNKQIGNLRAQLAAAQQETPAQTQARILKDVAGLHAVPQNESPTVAQVTDKTKLGGQPFLANAENGDYIIVYAKAKLSILYRPSENKIINVGAVTTDGQ